MLPPLTLFQLQVFAAVARAGGFRRAADSLLISEPAVSEHVKHLEQVVGARLIQRASGRRSIELTDAGRALLDATTSALHILEAGVEQAQAAAQGRIPSVKLAVSPTFGGYFLPPAYAAFNTDHPDVAVQLSVGNRAEVLAALAAGAADLGVVSEGTTDPALLGFPLLTFDMVLVGAPGHRLTGRTAAPFSELARERIITTGEQTAPRRAIEQLAAAHRVELSIVLELDDADMLSQAAASGLGVAVSSWPFLAQRLADGHLALLNVEGFPIQGEWYLVQRREPQSAPVRTLRDHLLHYPWPSGAVPAGQLAA